MVPTPASSRTASGSVPEKEAAVRIVGLHKRFGDVTALGEPDLSVRQGEFFTLLGPSGSGKTTLLRLIAGFERPDAGRIELPGRDVTRVPPYARDVNTVFQDYALFPHMSVAENIEYGLRVRHVAKAQRRGQVEQGLGRVWLPPRGCGRTATASGEGGRVAGEGPPPGAGRPQAGPAVRRPASARRIGPGHRERAYRAAAGRGARCAGPQAPPGNAARSAAVGRR